MMHDDHNAEQAVPTSSTAVKSIFETITDDEVRLFVCPAFSSSNQPAHSVGPRLVFPPSSVAQPCANAVFSIYSHFPTGACHTLQVNNKGRHTASNIATYSELACSERPSNPSTSQLNMCATQAATNHTRQLLSRAQL
ncbi:hypothetical protein BDZ89DRAFT_93767 [Hymenopellis radicata]|nr:hypothetical protein BDZ89DRAFT_93767 [Hymenopellis radicata]